MKRCLVEVTQSFLGSSWLRTRSMDGISNPGGARLSKELSIAWGHLVIKAAWWCLWNLTHAGSLIKLGCSVAWVAWLLKRLDIYLQARIGLHGLVVMLTSWIDQWWTSVMLGGMLMLGGSFWHLVWSWSLWCLSCLWANFWHLICVMVFNLCSNQLVACMRI